MGIRYYAYAFDAELTAQAIADPFTILSSDPLADAWGLEPGAAVSVTMLGQTVPERDMLYLDKAWSALQALTEPGPAGHPGRPSFRLFEGWVRIHDCGWEPWVRTLHPDEIPAIERDLSSIGDAEALASFRETARYDDDRDAEATWVLGYLHKAQTFVSGLAAEGRGAVYKIG